MRKCRGLRLRLTFTAMDEPSNKGYNTGQMRTPNAKSFRQDRAIAALAHGGTNADAARAAGVHRQRISEWRREPEFTERLEKAQNNAFREAKELLEASSLGAVQTLALRVAEGDIRAAIAILDRIGITKENASNRNGGYCAKCWTNAAGDACREIVGVTDE